MVTNCFSSVGLLDLKETAFIQDTLKLLVVIGPGALCLTLWRIFVTHKSGGGEIVSLGLDDCSLVYAGTTSHISHIVRLSYCVTALLTFALGSMASNVFKLCSQWFYSV